MTIGEFVLLTRHKRRIATKLAPIPALGGAVFLISMTVKIPQQSLSGRSVFTIIL